MKQYELCNRMCEGVDLTDISAVSVEIEDHLSASKVLLDLMLKMEDESVLDMPELFFNLFSSSFVLTKAENGTRLQKKKLEEQTSGYKKTGL